MTLIAAGLLSLAGWTAAECAVTQNFMTALREREERRSEIFSEQCYPFSALPDEPTACTEWRKIQGIVPRDPAVARAEDQLLDVIADRCGRAG